MKNRPIGAVLLGFSLVASNAVALDANEVKGEACPASTTLVTYQEATADRAELCKKLGTWDIARLAGGGSMDGPGYACKTREQDTRHLGNALCKAVAPPPPLPFGAVEVTGEACPAPTTLLTYQEATANRAELCKKLGTWDIARLAGGGSMDGPGYACKTRDRDTRHLGNALCRTLAAPGTSDPAHTLVNGVVAYYPFEVNAEDESGDAHDGIPTSFVEYAPGQYNTAALFTVPGARVDLPDMGRYADAYTISTWVNLKALTSPGGSTRGLGTLVGRLYVRRGDGKLVFYFYFDSPTQADNQARELVSNRSLPAGSWHHVAAVYDNASQVFQFVIDGVVDSTVHLNLGAIRPQFPSFRAIGGEERSDGDYTLNGMVDDVLLHRRALTQAELTFLATGAGRSPSSPQLSLRTRDIYEPPNCGEFNVGACYPCTEHFWWPPWMWGECRVHTATCHHDLVLRNGVCTCPAGQVHGRAQASPKALTAFEDQQCFTPAHPAPVFNVQALPGTIDIEGYPKRLTGIKGFQATISNIESADFLVADGTDLPADCGRLTRYKDYACGARQSSCSALTTKAQACTSQPPLCRDLNVTDNTGRALRFPLYTLQEWQNLKPTRLKINANWFDINGPPGFPHISPCTDIYGYSVNDGRVVSQASNPDVVGSVQNLLDALVVIDEPLPDGTTHRSVRIVKNSEIAGLRNVKYAVGGFILVQGGRSQAPYPSSVKGDNTGARTGVGLSADGQTMYIVVAQGGPNAGQMTAQDLSTYMKKKLGASDIINLDNSGSSQFLYSDGTNILMTEPGDYDPNNRKVYRPVPNFFGIR